MKIILLGATIALGFLACGQDSTQTETSELLQFSCPGITEASFCRNNGCSWSNGSCS